MEHLRRLVEACVALSEAPTANKAVGEGDIPSGSSEMEESAISASPASEVSADDRLFWDALGERGDGLIEDVGLFLATTNVSTDKMIKTLRLLLAYESFDCVGVVRLVQSAFRGFKYAKRWDCLLAASSSDGIVDAVHAKVSQASTMDSAMRFWLQILLGYQHTAELYLRSHTQLLQFVQLLSEKKQTAEDPIAIGQVDELIKTFILACAALIHCHRGYESEADALQTAIQTTFGPEFEVPAANAVEVLLREASWVLSSAEINKYLPSVEGKWVLDEFSNEQIALGASPSQNAGSIRLRKLGNCFAHEFSATMKNAKTNSTLQLDGSLFQPLQEMQVLLAETESKSKAHWGLEGHWSQLHGFNESSQASNVSISSLVPTEWVCQACTMRNLASATKCSTCGTEPASSLVSQPTTDIVVQGSNPAPFSAVFDATYSFMRIRWSRGEQQGVWLAKKEIVTTSFDLQPALAEANEAMIDTANLPMHAYSPGGIAANVFVLEKPIACLVPHSEFTIQLWIRPEPSSSDQPKQTILANGCDFELYITTAGQLVWEVGFGKYSVMSSRPVAFGEFSHVSLLGGKDEFKIMVNNELAGEIRRSSDQEKKSIDSKNAVFAIGGTVESLMTALIASSCFYGAILDLRIWSVLLSSQSGYLCAAKSSLSGGEDNLVGYYPLVGADQRLLMDLSGQDNHACVVTAYLKVVDLPILSTVVSNFAPSTPLDNLPVSGQFTISLGNAFTASGKISVAEGNQNTSTLGLAIDPDQFGAAIWQVNPINIGGGFDTSFALDSAPSSTNCVLAFCESSFWEMSPLLSEAAESFNTSFMKLVDGASSSETSRKFKGSALFVSVNTTSSGNESVCYNFGVHVWCNERCYALSKVYRVAVASLTTSDIQVKYDSQDQWLSVEAGSSGVVFECAVDLSLALRLNDSSTLRTGLIFPSQMTGSQSPPTVLREWKFSTLDLVNEGKKSILDNIYLSFGNKESSRKDNSSSVNGIAGLITCTKYSTDGSAIQQLTYGCQTCNFVHGNALCRSCAILCHEGHELVAMGFVSSACACQTRGTGLCKCSTPVQESDHTSIAQPIKAPLWCCSKCTVINSSMQNECSVCGNMPPPVDNGTTGSALTPTPPPGPKPSTSRQLALVPVQKSDPPLTSWTCHVCTLFNEPQATKCSMCETPRPSAEPEVSGDEKKKDGLITLYYAAEGSAKQDSPAPSTWICSACTMENKNADDTCHMCATMRAIPIADPVDETEVELGVPASITDAVDVTPPVSNVPAGAKPTVSTATSTDDQTKMSNLKLLYEYKNTVAQISHPSADIKQLETGSWDTTGGKLNISVKDSFVGEYINGTYLENDGYLSGIARLNQDNMWKLEGKFRKALQSQENAFVIQWDQSASRFEGKWFRGDGSGEWKCLASPDAFDFRGLMPTDPFKSSNECQPFYSGLVNMKQNLTNVCYQNSFLQTLLMTEDFRRMILACDSDLYEALPMDTEGENAPTGNILRCVQDLFARAVVSQRPSMASHALQRCLPAIFQAGRQQDTSDFAHFLIDSLSQQLVQQQDTADGISNLFGGTQATILACKTCGKTSVNREYFWELLLNMIDLKYTPITSITAVTGSSMNVSTPFGFERLNNDLNKDRNGAPYVFLCVKRNPERDSTSAETDPSLMPITDLVVKTALASELKPILDGYERVELDLNLGGGGSNKKQVYLFVRREPDGSPITDIQITYENEATPDGFKQIGVDLNQGEGSKVFLCYRCDMPITDVKIVNSGIHGYKMIDHLLNLSHEDAFNQYLALKVGGNEPSLTDIQLVDGDEVAQYQEQGWQSIGCPTSSTFVPDAADGTMKVPSQLMVRRGHGNPIFAIDVFRAPRQVPKYKDYEVIDIYPSSVGGMMDEVSQLKGDWMANEDTDRSRRGLRISSISDPIPETLLIKGELEDKGEIVAIASVMNTWSQSVTADMTSVQTNAHFRLTGYWNTSKVKQPQLFEVELRSTAGLYSINGTIGDGKGKSINVQGLQTSKRVNVKWPISEVMVLRGDERVPEGVEVVRDTCSGRSGNVLAQTKSPYTLYLAVKREEVPASGAYISDICVIYGEIDGIPDQYTCIETTPAGFSANLNDGTAGVPIFLCYRRGPLLDIENPTQKSLMDIGLMWTSGSSTDSLPAGFTKLQHTPLGMDANLNQGTSGVSIHLCFAKCILSDVIKPVEHALNGEYEMSTVVPAGFKFFRISVMEMITNARKVEGKFGTVLHAALRGSLQGILFNSKLKKKQMMLGTWCSFSLGSTPTTMTDFVPPAFPFQLAMNERCDELNGWWSGAEDALATSGTSSAGGTWKLMKDTYVRIAFKKDYGTEWKNGKLISSERVWRHDIASLLSRFVATRTLGGDNALSCSQCERKTESRAHTVIATPPEHLILTLKRMYYDWGQQKTRKCLHDVQFPAFLTLPALSEDEEEVLFTENEQTQKKKQRKRQYGLYGVLVHSGMTANSGHYYSFCRESSTKSKQLHFEDSPLTPWIKFNDMKVETSNWKEINRLVANSISDSVYLLLYKRIEYDIPPSDIDNQEDDGMEGHNSSGEEDEAMLLAKAMALSMAAVSQNDEHGKSSDGESKQETDKNETHIARPEINRSVLKKVRFMSYMTGLLSFFAKT